MKVGVDSKKIDELFRKHDLSNAPGFALGIALDGQPLYRRGFGLANLDQPHLLTTGTRIRIGSVSKQFTAMAILLLAEDGKLDPDDDIRKIIPELPDWADAISLHQLITHTSGMRCSLDLLALTSGIMGKSLPLPYDEQFKLLSRLSSTNFAPGTDWSYCNGGYVLLTKTIERASGLGFGEFLQRRIFNPLGMYDTQARKLDTDFLAGSASLHVALPDGTYRRGIFGPEIGGEGNLVSTVDDMLRWLDAMHRRRIGNDRTWQQMWRSGTVNGIDTGYACGLVHNDWRGIDVIFHSGHVMGAISQMLKVPSLGLDIVMLTNTSGIDPIGLTYQALEACIEGLEAQPLRTSGKLPSGNFLSPDTGRFVSIVEKDGAAMVEMEPAMLPVRYDEAGRGWVPANLMKGAFLKPVGESIEWEEFGAVDRLERVPPPSGRLELSGRFRSAETEAEAIIDENHLLIQTSHGKASYRLSRKSDALWTIISDEDGWTGIIERDGEDFLLSSLRIRRLRFNGISQNCIRH